MPADSEQMNDEVQSVSQMLEQGVRDLFTSEQYTAYLEVMDKFHEYSFNNTVLIAHQKPDATLVAGYTSWQNNFNRHVKRGEKGIRIVAPSPITVHRNKNQDRDSVDNSRDDDSDTITIPRYKTVSVFDISQTDGEPLPERPGVKLLTDDVSNFDSVMAAVRNICPVPMRYDDISGTANGYYDATAKEIVIRNGMPEAQTVKTAIHETVHAILHDPDRLRQHRQGRVDQVTREVEAESTAYLVCHHYSIDTSDYTFPYVAAWSSSVEMNELRRSMNTIRDAAVEIITSLDAQLNPQELEHENVVVRQTDDPEVPGPKYELDERAEQIEHTVYEQIEMFGIPMLYTQDRIEDVPQGMFKYELRGSDADPDGPPATMEQYVSVNYGGAVLSPVRIPFAEQDRRLNITGQTADSRGYVNVRGFRDFLYNNGYTMHPNRTRSIVFDNIIRSNESAVLQDDGIGIGGGEVSYAIYQLNGDAPYKFMGTDFMSEHDMAVQGIDYNIVYGGVMSAEGSPESLFHDFNINIPENFKGHSMSVSDVVVINRNGIAQAFYCDSEGFTPLPDFIREREELSEAKEAINEFARAELENISGADFSDPEHVSLIYTENDNGDMVQAEADLVHFRINKYTDSPEVPAETQQFDSLRDMIDNGLWKMDAVSLAELNEQTEERSDTEQTAEQNIDIRDIPVYRGTIEEAAASGHEAEYIESHAADNQCVHAIADAIHDNFDGTRLNSAGAESVLETYGPDRVEYVLASMVQAMPEEGRIIPDNRQWAESIVSDDRTDLRDYRTDVHPAVLDGFIRQSRNEADRIREAERMSDTSRLEQAMSAAGYEYDAVNSSEHHLVFHGDDGINSTSFDNWEEVTDWLGNVDLEDPERAEHVDLIMSPESHEDEIALYTRAMERAGFKLNEDITDRLVFVNDEPYFGTVALNNWNDVREYLEEPENFDTECWFDIRDMLHGDEEEYSEEEPEEEIEEDYITEDTDNIEVEDREGLWSVVDSVERNGEKYFLIESDSENEEFDCVLNKDGIIVVEDVENGFDEDVFAIIDNLAESNIVAEENEMTEEEADIEDEAPSELAAAEKEQRQAEDNKLIAAESKLDAVIEQFASDMDELGNDFDRYNYMDTVEDYTANVDEIISQVELGDTDGLKEWLNGVILDEGECAERADDMLNQLEGIEDMQAEIESMRSAVSAETSRTMEAGDGSLIAKYVYEDRSGNPAQIVTMESENGFYNYFDFDAESGKGTFYTGPFDSLSESRQNVKQHEPTAQEMSVFGADMPLYPFTEEHAEKHGETAEYNESRRRNAECRAALEEIAAEQYSDSSESGGRESIQELADRFGIERVEYVLAYSVSSRQDDPGISQDNKQWSETVRESKAVDLTEGCEPGLFADGSAENCAVNCSADALNQMSVDIRTEALERSRAEEEKETPEISFYVDGNAEMPILGPHYEGMTLEEAIKIYQGLPDDSGKGIGFCLHDGSAMDGVPFTLAVNNSVVDYSQMESVKDYVNNPLVKDAAEQIERAVNGGDDIPENNDMSDVGIDHDDMPPQTKKPKKAINQGAR